MAALGLARAPAWFRRPFEALTFVSIIVPEIVIALATLVFYSTSFDIVREIIRRPLEARRTRRSSAPTPCSTSAW